MFKLRTGLIDGSELNFDKCFLHFDVKNVDMRRVCSLKEQSQFNCQY